jgi:hypothetical protein
MKKMSVWISISTTVLLVLVMLVSGIAVAQVAKVNVCHRTGNGTYRLISISERAVPAHLAHGDGLPGDPVPRMEGKIFGPDCSLGNGPQLSGYQVDKGDVGSKTT